MELLDLPEELLIQIFRYDCQLHICAVLSVTCKKFHTICQSKNLWREILTKNISHGLISDFFWKLVKINVFKHVKSLTLEYFSELHDMVKVSMGILELTSLSYIDVGTVFLGDLLHVPNIHQDVLCPSLKHFKFHCKYQQTNDEDMDFSILCSIQNSSKYYSNELYEDSRPILSCFVNSMSEFLSTIYEENPHRENGYQLNCLQFLTALEVFGKEEVCCNAVELNVGPGAECIVNYLNQFNGNNSKKELDFLVNLHLLHADVSDNDMKVIASYLRNLRSLSIHGCPSVTDFAIECIASNLQFLQAIDLSKAVNDCGGNITDYGLETLLKGCPLLKDINISKCTNVGNYGISALAANTPCLTRLDASECVQITDESIAELTGKCHKLQVLYLGGCVQVTHQSLAKSLLECFHLHKASFENCYKISQEGFSKASKNILSEKGKSLLQNFIIQFPHVSQPHSHIRDLDLSFCSHFDDIFIKDLVDLCPDLQSINFRGCHQITDTAVGYIVEYCRGLRHLDVSGGSILQASKLTDTSLECISKYGHSLENLVVLRNDIITSTGVLKVLETCSRLKSLQLTCSLMSHEALKNMMIFCSRKVMLDMPHADIKPNSRSRFRCTITVIPNVN